MDALQTEFQTAFMMFQQGTLSEAEQICLRILQKDAHHGNACHLLGMISFQIGDFDKADAFYTRAAKQSVSAVLLSNHGLALYALERFEEALEKYDNALRLRADYSTAHNNRGMTLQKLGKHVEALQSYEKALALDPQHAEAFNNRGVIFHEMGRLDEALNSFEQAIRLIPSYAEAYLNRGNLYRDAKQLDRAIENYSTAIKINPRYLEAIYNRGVAYFVRQEFDQALDDYRQVLSINPSFADALMGIGVVLGKLKRFDEAASAYKNLIEINPEYPDIYSNYGLMLGKLGRNEEAFAFLDRLLVLYPQRADGWLALGNALLGLGRYEKAIASYKKALSFNPRLDAAWLGCGNVQFFFRQYAEALAAYDAALSINPDLAGALVGRGNVLVEMARDQDALVEFDAAIALAPDMGAAWMGRGNALLNLQRFAEARAANEKAICADGNRFDALYNLSRVQLLQGDFADGWKNYEYRKQKQEKIGVLDIKKPLLESLEQAEGRVILVHWEQGLGDTIHFCRYIPLLEKSAAKVLFAPQNPLRGLLSTLSSSVELTTVEELRADFDFHIGAMSLPGLFKTDFRSIPASIPYLHPQTQRVLSWRSRLGTTGFRIGICWKGNSDYKDDKRRSFSLALFEDISVLPGVRLISLHKGDGEGQVAELAGRVKVETLGEGFDSGPDAFLDAAAVMANLDLVITSDTSIAHLAGALGIPTWVALRKVPDWRWMLERDDSPWYPTMRLFRQKTDGDWAGVFIKIRQALVEKLANRSTST